MAEIRKDNKLSQHDFARILCTSQSHISGIEKNNKSLTSKMRRLLCIEFGVNEDWIITGDGSKYNSAVIDVEAYHDSARGINPTDPLGSLKADAIILAARLNEIYPNICLSCDSIDLFIELFMIPEFADVFNTLAYSFLSLDVDKGASFRMITKILSGVITNEMLDGEKEEIIKERIAKQQKEPLPNYLHNLYTEYKNDGLL